ncbi:MAG: hypothetical protein NTX59_00015 [Elusimicrobia bacterium]|nr:hypothetical protein [Elusimicrobiota bacterium]
MQRYKLLIFLFLSFFAEFSYAGDLSLGLGCPYISLKYDFKVFSAEGRYITGLGVRAYTGRGYWNFHQSDTLKSFIGLEGGYITFDTRNMKGTGRETALFVGGEYFAAKNLSLLMDFAPTFISLSSGNTGINCVEYVINLGFYYHF